MSIKENLEGLAGKIPGMTEVKVNMPDWISILNPNHSVKKIYVEKIKESL